MDYVPLALKEFGIEASWGDTIFNTRKHMISKRNIEVKVSIRIHNTEVKRERDEHGMVWSDKIFQMNKTIILELKS